MIIIHFCHFYFPFYILLCFFRFFSFLLFLCVLLKGESECVAASKWRMCLSCCACRSTCGDEWISYSWSNGRDISSWSDCQTGNLKWERARREMKRQEDRGEEERRFEKGIKEKREEEMRRGKKRRGEKRIWGDRREEKHRFRCRRKNTTRARDLQISLSIDL